ncbi:aspartate aminotransferase [Fulvivirga imtechensis AK7]|uniref:Aspartate aminotransferase n=1 Tax=Fulvivirga imtechensis AK7 TaxID=1237149 RepID=L8JLI5_9BACT|nr:hypothetical protein [Fulvivirga imtechensis]ELR69113.1 aspartate aminotransferase [Fulvivirga imtechensis AK7]
MYNSNNNKPSLAWKGYLCIFLIMLCVFPAVADKAGFNFINNKRQTTIRFKLIGNLIVIPVKVNNNLDLNLVLDTGGRSLIIFGRHFEKKLPVLPDKKVRIQGYGSKDHLSGNLSINNLVSISDVEGKGIGIAIVHNKNFFPYDGATEIHGIIGYQIFSRFVVKIDYPNRNITMYEPMAYVPMEKDLQSVPLIIKDTKPYINGSIRLGEEQRDVHFHVDTGSSREVILFKRDQDHFFSDEILYRCSVGKGLNGLIKGYKSGNISLGLASDNYREIETYLVERKFSDRELREAAGTIGSGFLKNFIVIFDYVSQRFYFKKVA